jgi:hypothetical protein
MACCEQMTDQRHGGEMTGCFLLMAAPSLATAEQRCARGSHHAIACSSDPATAGKGSEDAPRPESLGKWQPGAPRIVVDR